MIKEIEKLNKEAQNSISSCKNLNELQELKVTYLGKKGRITNILKTIGKLPAKQRPKIGQKANELKNKISSYINSHKKLLENTKQEKIKEEINLDITLPGDKIPAGSKHPISKITEDICEILSPLGFKTVLGPEMETEYHNFEALNIPTEHPSRDVFDTFYLGNSKNAKVLETNKTGKWLLRSQTSTVQIRIMENYSPPLKIVAPGKVYRPDTPDASHSFMFHQIEGLMVDKNVTFSQLKGTLLFLAQELFTPDIKVRFRPHFFPFTEPSVEMDISCIICQGKGCRVCSNTGWLEILGAGMVDPNVFKTVGYNHNKYTGFAFGMGVERLAMLKYGIEDIRLFTENDIRFLKQF